MSSCFIQYAMLDIVLLLLLFFPAWYVGCHKKKTCDNGGAKVSWSGEWR
jgi:hypothetical protein